MVEARSYRSVISTVTPVLRLFFFQRSRCGVNSSTCDAVQLCLFSLVCVKCDNINGLISSLSPVLSTLTVTLAAASPSCGDVRSTSCCVVLLADAATADALVGSGSSHCKSLVETRVDVLTLSHLIKTDLSTFFLMTFPKRKSAFHVYGNWYFDLSCPSA